MEQTLMPGHEIEEFARQLASVRDEAVRSCDSHFKAEVTSPIAKRWKDSAKAGGQAVVPDVVDETLFYLLDAIDHGRIRLKFVSKGGREVDLTEEGGGELAGWFLAEWRSEYAKERFVDDFADVDWRERSKGPDDE
jgi:hypothetical protein